MKININLVKGLATIGVFALLIVLFSFFTQEEKIAYIELQKVFQSFEGKVELEKRLQQSEWNAQLYVDSLTLQLSQLQTLQSSGKGGQTVLDEIQKVQAQKASIEQQAYEIHTKKSEEFTNQIWSQLNQYVKDFGEENDYDFILGAEGAGSLMYGKTDKNVTEEVISFINKKYHGE